MRALFLLTAFLWAQSVVVAATFVGEIQSIFKVTERIDGTTTIANKDAPLRVTLTTDYTTMRWSVDVDADLLMAGGPTQAFETRLAVNGNLTSRQCVAPCSLAGLGDPSPLSFPNAVGQSGAGDFVLLGSADWTITDRIVTAVRERHCPQTEILASGNASGSDTTATNPGNHYLSVLTYPLNIRLTPFTSDSTATKNESGQWVSGDHAINLGRITDGNDYLEVHVTPGLGAIDLWEVLPGDFSESGAVDAGDFVVWRKSTGTLSPFLTSYDVWRSNFDSETPLRAGTSAVPEHSTFQLAMIVACGMFLSRRIAR